MRNSLYPVLREYPWRQQAICFAPLALMAAILIYRAGSGDDLTRFFTSLRETMPLTTSLMALLSDWLIYSLYGIYAVIFTLALRSGNRPEVRRVCIFALVQLFVTILLVQIVKTAIGSPRPLEALNGAGASPWGLDKEYHSFPSGHTAEASSAALTLAARFRRPLLSLLFGLFIAFVAFSRLYLSRHHLPDIAGGACAGLAASLLNFYLCYGEPS